MSTIASGYDYVFELASQLSPEEQERLVREMDAHRQVPEGRSTNVVWHT